jgi:hypothetical protein
LEARSGPQEENERSDGRKSRPLRKDMKNGFETIKDAALFPKLPSRNPVAVRSDRI